MPEATRHDAWRASDAYDAYMGRWSRPVASSFLDWLDISAGRDWLEAGCGTGALSATILARCDPRDLLAVDPSADFVAAARRNVPDARARFAVGDAQALGEDTGSRDVIVSALVLNFVPDRERALAEMKRVLRPGGTLGFYVWDYPGGGIAFMHAFWTAAAEVDPAARDLSEARRFSFCTREALVELVQSAGFQAVKSRAIEVPTVFSDFDDYWRPFTLGAGPAPGYCANLDAGTRARLRTRLQNALPQAPDGSIPLEARAWAVSATS